MAIAPAMPRRRAKCSPSLPGPLCCPHASVRVPSSRPLHWQVARHTGRPLERMVLIDSEDTPTAFPGLTPNPNVALTQTLTLGPNPNSLVDTPDVPL